MRNEEKYKYLAKNVGLLTLSSFSVKILSFFLVPLYTNILTTTEYGTYDLINTTISILVPILTLDIQDAVIRFSIEKKSNDDAIITISSRYLIISTLILSAVLIINHITNISEIMDQYAIYFLLLYISIAFSGIMTAYARGSDHITDLSISSVVSSAVTICSNIFFLAIVRWGLEGYFIANILGPTIQCFYLMLRLNIWGRFHLRTQYASEKREMTAYSKPLIANSIAWWGNSASDKYIVTWFCGLSENGIYSIASKIPSILNILQTIFAQAWTLSVVKDYDPEDRNGFFKNIYNAYNSVLVIACSGIILFDRFLASFLYAKEFYEAWRYVPFLTIAIVFGSLSGYLGGFFSAVKDSKIFAQSTIIGAIVNAILSLISTQIIGALGAAIATAFSYITVWGLRLYHSKKYINLRLNLLRDFIAYVFLIAQAFMLLIINKEGIFLYIIEGILFLLIILLYISEFKKIVILIVQKAGNKLGLFS